MWKSLTHNPRGLSPGRVPGAPQEIKKFQSIWKYENSDPIFAAVLNTSLIKKG